MKTLKPTKMPSVDLFTPLHKGLRALLFETARQLQQTDFHQDAAADEAMLHVIGALQLFNEQSIHEEQLLFRVLDDYEPGVVDAFRQDQAQTKTLSGVLNQRIVLLCDAETDQEKIKRGLQLMHSFLDFLSFQLGHMAKKEAGLTAIVTVCFSKEQLKDCYQRMTFTKVAYQQRGLAKWVMNGISNEEAAAWLRWAEEHAAAPVFQSLFALAEKELSPKRFRTVLELLSEGVMMA